jgi:hypothetical protein
LSSEGRSLDAATLAGLLADDDRRRVAAALMLDASSVDDVIRVSGLAEAAAGKALARLASAGLVVRGTDGTVHLVGEAFGRAARSAAMARPAASRHDGPPEIAKVFDAFVRDGRLLAIPTARAKRLVILDHLAQEFELGRRYSEQMVNLLLGKWHADTAALRRYLVDEGFLDRADGEYWRSGGTVE